MTKRKPLPEGHCPHCGVTYLALTRDEILRLALDHVEGEHPAVVASWESGSA